MNLSALNLLKDRVFKWGYRVKPDSNNLGHKAKRKKAGVFIFSLTTYYLCTP